jgi:hypothetical protein
VRLSGAAVLYETLVLVLMILAALPFDGGERLTGAAVSYEALALMLAILAVRLCDGAERLTGAAVLHELVLGLMILTPRRSGSLALRCSTSLPCSHCPCLRSSSAAAWSSSLARRCSTNEPRGDVLRRRGAGHRRRGASRALILTIIAALPCDSAW